MRSKILVIGIIILAGTALVLGYAIVRQNTSEELTDGLLQSRFSALDEQDAKTREEPLVFQDALPLAEELGITKDERATLAHPAKDAPAEEKQSHFELVQKIAKEAQHLDITKCKVANPVVLKVKLGEPITVKNQDSVDHAIVFDADNIFSIPANTTMDIKPDFQFGSGTYGYGCDQTPHTVGIFLVTQ